jgi:hypothetical protein
VKSDTSKSTKNVRPYTNYTISSKPNYTYKAKILDDLLVVINYYAMESDYII